MKRRCLMLTVLVIGISHADEYRLDSDKPKGADPFFRIHQRAKWKFKWGFIDARGNTVIRPQFDNEGYFFNGLASVLVGRLYGYINESGRIVIPARYRGAGDFHGQLAPVRVGRKWGYIDQKGRVVIAPAFHFGKDWPALRSGKKFTVRMARTTQKTTHRNTRTASNQISDMASTTPAFH